MNKEEYIIINKSVLEKRIEELEDIEKNSTLKSAARIDTIRELKQIISQSTPLIPEIEKQSINFAKNLLNNTIIKAKSIEDIEEYHPKEYQLLLGELEFYGKERFKDYISNLKLDI